MPPRDLKRLREVPNQMVQLLRRGLAFSFCFIVDRERRLFADASVTRESLEGLIDAVASGGRTTGSSEFMRKLKLARQELSKKSANLKLVENILIAATLSAYVASLISRHSMARLISWVPDRDNITEAYDRLADNICGFLLNGLSLQFGMQVPTLQAFTQSADDLWCDPFIRPADCIAAAAAWDYPKHDAVPEKIAGLLEKVFTDNLHAHFIQISYHVNSETGLVVEASRVKMLSRPNFSDGKLRPENLTALRGRSRRLSTFLPPDEL